MFFLRLFCLFFSPARLVPHLLTILILVILFSGHAVCFIRLSTDTVAVQDTPMDALPGRVSQGEIKKGYGRVVIVIVIVIQIIIKVTTSSASRAASTPVRRQARRRLL